MINNLKQFWKAIPDKDVLSIIFILMILTIYLMEQAETLWLKLVMWLVYTITINIVIRVRKKQKQKNRKR